MIWSVNFGLGGTQFESRRGREKMSIAFVCFSRQDIDLWNGLDR
jgi:hypothetical protein